MITSVRKYFISGLLVWLPIIITVLVLKVLVDLLSKSLLLLPPSYTPDVLLGFHIPGIGMLLTLLVILLTGLVTRNFIGQWIVARSDAMMSKIPLVRSVYNGVKQVTETLFLPGGQSFRKVLMVEYPCKGVWTIAFQTGEVGRNVEGSIKTDPMISYFVPTTPNPTSGFLMMAPKDKVVELDMSVDQALKFVISLGVVQPYATNGKSGHKPKTKEKVTK